MTTPPHPEPRPEPDKPEPDKPEPEPGQPAPDQPFPSYPVPPPLYPAGEPPYGSGPGYDHGGYGAPPVRPRNGMGVAALTLGIIGFLIGPASILAIVFGRIGLNRAARGEATNRGVAQAGFVLGLVTLALWILGIILLANRR